MPAVLKAAQALIAKWLLKTEHDLIIWAHYRNHAARRGHSAKHPVDCEDDDCIRVTK